MTPDSIFPPMIYTLWWATIALALLVFVPLAVYSLWSLVRATRSIQRYARESLTAAQAIGANTAVLPALDSTISVATEVVAAAEQVASKLDTIAGVLETRAAGGRR